MFLLNILIDNFNCLRLLSDIVLFQDYVPILTLCSFQKVRKYIDDVSDPEQYIATLVQTKSDVLQVNLFCSLNRYRTRKKTAAGLIWPFLDFDNFFNWYHFFSITSLELKDKILSKDKPKWLIFCLLSIKNFFFLTSFEFEIKF